MMVPELIKQLTLKTVQRTPFNAEAPLAALAEIPTPTRLFYVRSNFEIPRLDLASWRLRVSGAVRHPREFRFADLRRFPIQESLVLLECAGNGRQRMIPVPSGVAWDIGAVGCALFRGISLCDLLNECGIDESAIEVLFVGADSGEVEPGRTVHFERSIPLERALDPAVLFASHMNGEPLSAEHGYPLRVLVPRWYAVSSVKWVIEVRVLTQPFTGPFQTDRYIYIDDVANPDGTPVRDLRVRALIAQPADEATVQSGRQIVRGIAWSGAARIAAVEVSTNGGEAWDRADLTQPLTPSAPTLWSFTWSAVPGTYNVLARAVDEMGNTQPLDPTYNRLGYGNNVIQRITVMVA